jgi:16S rRNA processing protein RimM
VGDSVKRELAPEGAKEVSRGEFITLARVVKTQGRHGEVAVEVHSDVPDRFAEGMKLFALKAAEGARQDSKSLTKAEGASQQPAQATNAERVLLKIEGLWPHKGLLVLKFAGIDSMNDAETLIGAELQVRRSERAKLEQGWTYVSDLAGCAVFDHGREVGRIEDVQFGAGEAPLLIVASASEGDEVTKYEIPFAEAYLEGVDIARKQVRMNLPDGMLEINAPMTAEEKKQQAGSRKNRH